MDMMDSMDPSMGGAMMVWMAVWALITVGALVLIVLGILRLTHSLRRDRDADRVEHDTPREILDRRYADGEIDEDEYLTRVSGLTQT